MKHQSDDLQQVFIEGKLFWINKSGTWIRPAVRGGAGEEDPPDDDKSKDEKPTITQTQMDAILATRIGKARDKAVTDLLKDLGAESADALKELLKNAKSADDLNKSELTKATEKLTGIEGENATLKSKLATVELNTAVVLALVDKGLTVAAAKVSAKLVEVDENDDDKIKKAIADLEKTMPQLFVKSDGTPVKGGNPGTPPPGGGGNGSDPAAQALKRLHERHPQTAKK